MNPISVAIKGKGSLNFLRRTARIVGRYGVSPARFDRALAQFVETLDQFGCKATFPITLVALQRHPNIVHHYQAQGIEFAVHGYRHVDHSQLTRAEQSSGLTLSKRILDQAEIQARGFRGPYLRWSFDTLAALKEHGFVYDASQALTWSLPEGIETTTYRRAVQFYRALSASDYPSVPSLQDGLVRIPYSLPDDEALVERLALRTPDKMSALWLDVLRQTYELGELFTVGLHPERLPLCRNVLANTLAKARTLAPSVWIARLDEIAAWWQARTKTTINLAYDSGLLHISVVGPAEVTVLARGVEMAAPTAPWADNYRQVGATEFAVRTQPRPLIGVSPATSPALVSFLQQQGYIVQVSDDRRSFSYYLDEPEFTAEQERSMLAQIEGTDRPLIRLGRWPNGARSAMAVTGDIDALTLWDYGLRLFGR